MKTIRQDIRSKKTLRLLETSPGSYAGVVIDNARIIDSIKGEDPEDIWAQLQAIAGGPDDFVGFSGALNRFRKFFPDGMESSYFKEKEDDYKRAAAAQLVDQLPLEAAKSADVDATLKALRAFQATNLLFSIEKAKLSDLLKSNAGPKFIRRIAEFTEAPGVNTLEAVNQVLRPVALNKWTVVSYLPAYWRPDAFLFLKPSVTLAFAERVGNRLARVYQPEPDWQAYSQLHDMAEEILIEISSLKPKDYIDVQSFVWTVMTYTGADAHHSE